MTGKAKTSAERGSEPAEKAREELPENVRKGVMRVIGWCAVKRGKQLDKGFLLRVKGGKLSENGRDVRRVGDVLADKEVSDEDKALIQELMKHLGVGEADITAAKTKRRVTDALEAGTHTGAERTAADATAKDEKKGTRKRGVKRPVVSTTAERAPEGVSPLPGGVDPTILPAGETVAGVKPKTRVEELLPEPVLPKKKMELKSDKREREKEATVRAAGWSTRALLVAALAGAAADQILNRLLAETPGPERPAPTASPNPR